MKTKKERIVLLFVLVVLISINCFARTNDGPQKGIVYYMNPGLNQLIIEAVEETDEQVKIFYHGRDYTSHLEKFSNKKPPAFLDHKIIVYSKNGVVMDGDFIKCHDCIVVIPRYEELRYIEALDINYDVESGALICSTAVMQTKKINKDEK